MSDSVTPWAVAHQLRCPWNFPGKNTGVGCHFPSPGDLFDPGIKLVSPELQADSLLAEPSEKSSAESEVSGVAGTQLVSEYYLMMWEPLPNLYTHTGIEGRTL